MMKSWMIDVPNQIAACWTFSEMTKSTEEAVSKSIVVPLECRSSHCVKRFLSTDIETFNISWIARINDEVPLGIQVFWYTNLSMKNSCITL